MTVGILCIYRALDKCCIHEVRYQTPILNVLAFGFDLTVFLEHGDRAEDKCLECNGSVGIHRLC